MHESFPGILEGSFTGNAVRLPWKSEKFHYTLFPVRGHECYMSVYIAWRHEYDKVG